MRFLLIEDEPRISRFVTEGLQETGHQTVSIADGESGITLAEKDPYDAIILDVTLEGDLDGFGVAAELRRRNNLTPILMLTARDSTAEIIQGLEAGADDYLTKPFDFLELEARLRALARRRDRDGEQVVKSGSIQLDPVRGFVLRDDLPVALTPTEFRLLKALMDSPNGTTTRAELLESVWGLSFDPGTRLIDVHIANLRRKLEMGGRDRVIATVRGVGFELLDARAEA